jgi:hypothetical protein
VYVYSDGRVIFQRGSDHFLQTRADSGTLYALKSLVSDPQTAVALALANQDRLELTDEQGVRLLVNGASYEFACKQDPGVLKLFSKTTNTLARPFGHQIIPPDCN